MSFGPKDMERVGQMQLPAVTEHREKDGETQAACTRLGHEERHNEIG